MNVTPLHTGPQMISVRPSVAFLGEDIVMASDGCESGSRFEGFSLSISVPTEDEARRTFEALADGGEVKMPLDKTFWSPCFGMRSDRFGVDWMISVEDA